MKRVIALMLVLGLVLAAVPALADTARYCPVCEKTTNWKPACSLNRSGVSSYGLCGDYPNCNWYSLYRYNGEKCVGCGNMWTLSTDHACKGLHSVTKPYHNYSWCPY